MDSSKRPKKNPKYTVMKSSPRPKKRPDDLEEGNTLQRAIRHSQPDKMATGGMCRGMGSATKGGKYGRSG